MRYALALLLLGPSAWAGPPPANAPATTTTATAALVAKSGSAVTGTVTFAQTGADVKVRIEVKGATPGNHAVHIHEKGDCSAADATSAGGHFNPEAKAHGDVTMTTRHPGDFGNLTVGSEGTGVKEITVSSFTLAAGQALSVPGLSVIVHEKPDDFSQPTGNAGARQACGVIAVQ